MTFIRRLLGVDAPEPARKAVTGPGVAAYYNDPPLTSLSNSPQARAAKALQAYKCGWFYKAESKISRDIAQLGVSAAPEGADGENEVEVLYPDLVTPFEQLDPIHQFLRLMERPNPYQTGRALRQKTQIRVDMAGWGFWYLEGGAGGALPSAIYGISPTRMWPSVNKEGVLIGWVMDRDKPGGGVPFDASEILQFNNASPDDADFYGVGVVEAVWAEIPITDLIARHTGDLLTTGGRLAGMMWPKDRTLDENELMDATRAWRNVTSDPNAARRMLIFPEPMEYAQGASTPAEVGMPELSALNRDNILTAFPISPYQLGVPMPGGLNSAATRKEDRQDYWEGTIHPRVEAFEEAVQVNLLSRYEAVMGSNFDFDVEEPNLDDAASLTLKVAAYNDLVTAGFDDKEAREAVGLDGIKYIAVPALLDPVAQAAAAAQARIATQEARGQVPTVGQVTPPTPAPAPASAKPPAKAEKRVRGADDLDGPTRRAQDALTAFFGDQKHRTIEALRATLPASKVLRRDFMKADPSWWDKQSEDDALTRVMRGIYLEVGREGLQAVADSLGRTVLPLFTRNVIADLLEYGGERVKDINDRTLQAIVGDLAEGTRRGYSINQLIDGVPEEGFNGISGVALDNGTPAFSELRAETIARTETMLSYNRANVQGYAEFGVVELLAYDGDGDEECAERDGQTFSIDDALAIEDHPNGTLAWAPVLDKARHQPAPQPITVNAYITTPEMHVEPAVVRVEPAVVNVTPSIHVDAPNVTVQNPARKVVRGADGRIEGLE